MPGFNIEARSEFFEKYYQASLSDNKDFQTFIIEVMELLELDDVKASRLIEVDAPTIKRWRERRYSPHSIMREIVRDAFLKEVLIG
jgi:hypothetical protein